MSQWEELGKQEARVKYAVMLAEIAIKSEDAEESFEFAVECIYNAALLSALKSLDAGKFIVMCALARKAAENDVAIRDAEKKAAAMINKASQH